jgi:hypothetical protein
LNRSPRTIIAQATRAILLGNSSDLDRPTIYQARQAEPLRAVLARISDDSHRTGDEQPTQMSIASLRDPAKSLFAPRRMLSRHQADPCSETMARRERLPLSTSAISALQTSSPHIASTAA